MNEPRNPRESQRDPAVALTTIIARLTIVEHGNARQVSDCVDHLRELARLTSGLAELVSKLTARVDELERATPAEPALSAAMSLLAERDQSGILLRKPAALELSDPVALALAWDGPNPDCACGHLQSSHADAGLGACTGCAHHPAPCAQFTVAT